MPTRPLTRTPSVPQLRLDAIAGPPVGPVCIEPGETLVVGRSSQCDRRLADPSVSRRHCLIAQGPDYWAITDLGSRHGTYINGQRLEAEKPIPVERGDTVSVGPWTFRAKIGGLASVSRTTTNELLADSQHVETVLPGEMESLAQHRLDLLLNCAANLNSAADESELAISIVEAALEGSGFPRASIIRPGDKDGQVEVVAWRDSSGTATGELSFSRSLLEAASSGELVRMSGQGSVDQAHSIIQLGIQSALCAPVSLGPAVSAYLYLDAREMEANLHPDAAAFCQALARLYGLALSNLKRADLEKRNRQFQRDMDAAREAQALMLPNESGAFGRLQYAVHVRSGRHVAGDLFGIVPLSDTRTAFFIGDVTGKGVGAGIIMTATQTFLSHALRMNDSVAEAVQEANTYLGQRIRQDQFVSLWVGIIDHETSRLEYVDAGHGHWIMYDVRDGPGFRTSEGGLPIGVMVEEVYESESLDLGEGERIILFSDGIVEQMDESGEQFGRDRILEALTRSSTPGEDVSGLFRAVEEFAKKDQLADDATVASIELAPGP